MVYSAFDASRGWGHALGVSSDMLRGSTARFLNRRCRSVHLHSLICLIGSLVCALAGSARADLPNLVFILSDDQGIDAIEGANWPNDLNCRTPNLAKLATEGRVFSNCRANPFCSPTRAGLMTGRSALRTGVIGNVRRKDGSAPDRDLVSLQGNERTIAEVLQDMGYYTIHIDKWQLGYNADLNHRPEQQGFDVSYNRFDYYDQDDPDAVGDEHISLMVDLAIDSVENRPNGHQPYALFFWTIEPHEEYEPDSNGYGWWRVDESLLPSNESYYSPNPRDDSEVDRYRAVVESLDTEVGRLLEDLRIVYSDMTYRSRSDTVVFYMSDNGTPREIAQRPDHAKGSPYEGGVRVPMFVFGENVPDDGRILDRLISHVDLFDTMADIAGANSAERGDAPRDGQSFADDIGWNGNQLPEHRYTMSNVARYEVEDQRVALADRDYKLVTLAGGTGLADLSTDEFYDLNDDPDEVDNLVKSGMNSTQTRAYEAMRDAIGDYWQTAVGTKTSKQVDIPITDALALTSEDDKYSSPLAVGYYKPGTGSEIEARAFYRFNIDKIDQLLPYGKDFNDVIDAQILFGFASDAGNKHDEDTGVITAYPVTRDWYDRSAHWWQMDDEYQGSNPLGSFDPAPFIRTSLGTGGGILAPLPMPDGTPVTLGHSSNLLDQVKDWRDNPWSNHGIVLMAEPMPSVGGDQHIELRPAAALRLTLK
ncbi:MAG: hypothetical protein D8M59_01580 [Planctomycetes bacterium]|nr:hypothetical protein [Planctomycetota bacterium]NOG54587.1 sulfatase-like hydrolase/transferase [Planctomycetota bacterium]